VILSRASNLSEGGKEAISGENYRLSNEGLRVLGFAKREFDDIKSLEMDDENDLQYLGLMAEMDPPREESAQAVQDCRNAGIKPIMITGDHKITASAIARRIGLMQEGDLAFTGPEIDEMSDDELNEKLEHISVYARVSPDNKIRIVKAWQDKGHIVAMTGDGVNDGPALKSADVGVAMGITGTEVAKDSASMILTDDNFATIIKSVLNGRNIYANIKNAIKFLLSGNAAGILAVLYASLMGLPMPFTAVQLLFINLITDSLPALAISMEPSNPHLIKDKPRPRDESVIDKPTLREVSITGILIAVASMTAFYIGLGAGPGGSYGLPADAAVNFGAVTASTMAFSTLCLARLWHGFNCRGREGIFKLGLFTNLYTIGAFLLGALLLHMLLLFPVLSKAFNVAMLNPHLLGWVWGLSFAPTLIIQIYKAIKFRKEDKEDKTV
ncbi:MAG: cation-translocating P-type ATPase, partial [Clostridiales bacterium]|nr:cation-translocating P-type ATPase [Clostridiales bacterium]